MDIILTYAAEKNKVATSRQQDEALLCMLFMAEQQKKVKKGKE